MKIKFLYLLLILLPFVSGSFSNKLYISALAVSDTDIASQWYLDKIQATSAWEQTQGGDDVVVAVIDTGIDLDHPDLKSNIWVNKKEIPDNGIDDDNNGYVDDINGWDFIDRDNTPSPNTSNKYSVVAIDHGTAISGIISGIGNNAFAGAGISWNTKIMPLRVFNDLGESDAYLAEVAIKYAVDNGVDIINMSFVGFADTESFYNVIKYAYDKGVLLVAAVGNDSSTPNGGNFALTKSYPVCYSGPNGENFVLGVVALDHDDTKAKFSNYGSACSDISAPGVDIYSSLFQENGNDDFAKYFGGKFNGSSMSAPQVVGAAALIKHLHPNYTNKELTEVLLATTDNIDGVNSEFIGQLGSGRLNVLKAVSAKPISKESDEELKVKYVLGATAGLEPKIWLLDGAGNVLKEFYAFAPGFRGGINLAIGDIDNDGMTEIVAGAGFGGGPHVRIFNLNGALENQFFAFNSNNRNGVLLAVGDVDGNNRNEIVAVEAGKSKPIAKIFDQNGKEVGQDITLFDKIINNQISLTVSDVNKDGADEIIAGPAYGQVDKVKIFTFDNKQIGGFSPFGVNFSGGVKVTSGDLNNDGWSEILVSKTYDTQAIVKTYDFTGRLLSPGFSAYGGRVSGVNFSTGDRGNADGDYEIITTPNGGHIFELNVWDKNLNKIITLYPFGSTSTKKVNAYAVTR